jgi:hypothetical protein
MSVAGSALCASSRVWRSDAPVRRGVRFGFAIVLLCLIASVPATAGSRTWVYVALGDSNVYGAPNDCGHCTSYPLLVKRRIAATTGVAVTLINGSQHNKLTSAMLLHEIDSDD